MFTQEEIKAKVMQVVEAVKAKWATLTKQQKMVAVAAAAVFVLVMVV